MQLQYIGIILTLCSLILLYFAIRVLLKQLKLQHVALFKITDPDKSFEIKDPGLYAICFVGLSTDMMLPKLRATLKNSIGRPLQLKTNRIRYSFLYKRTITVEQWKFNTTDKGMHQLVLDDFEAYLKKNPIVRSVKIFSKRKTKTESLSILIKQTLTLKERLTLIGFVLGVNGLLWGAFLWINPSFFA